MATPISRNPFGTDPKKMAQPWAQGLLGAALVLESFGVVLMGGEVAFGAGSIGAVGRWLLTLPGLVWFRKNVLIGSLGPLEGGTTAFEASSGKLAFEFLAGYLTIAWWLGLGEVVMKPIYGGAVDALTFLYGPNGPPSLPQLPADGPMIEVISKTGLDRVLTMNLALVDP